MQFTRKDIDALEHLYKINFVNSLSGFKSANLIATKSVKEVTNVAVFSSVVHYGSAPPILGFVLRPTTVRRNTYDNIKETEFYTINHITESMIHEAHHTSAKYPSEISEFDKTALTEVYKNGFHAPFVKESSVQIAMKYVEEYPIKINNTLLILGEIVAVYVDEVLVEKDGFINLSKNETVAINGLDAYVTPANSKRLPYQRPK
ncbi:flavin reductase family protein [Tenacibaculum maritimum]|uniref:Flavin reductase domain-containing protein FMN-binding protein n=1 Tax=Tenacibaculum maritimum NCIMB 2154 TaxID=1349785 RepID=A0A2H1E775_9FLAO|nr:flavin reductase [Tenacibaculum maritimum]MCD9583967.1 flavin reductase [Tenacibaculum maritimum]MCD9610301.1 flavin reductase [Tenacibaculum maritimum]MCD9619983.1 flavin reductase [Tenacibaculum maritimum]MCD9626337.1 flavin reductase [Tenacibaculum maritimum]MCD9628912.1 flavin reductase [Tenacibaculum maritimum]